MSKEISPRSKARFAGFMYLLVILGGAFAEAYVRQRLMMPGDAAATAANILANEQLWRWGFVADLIPLLCNLVVVVIFYDLFKVVDKSVALLLVFFSLVANAVQGSVLLFHMAALMLAKGGHSLAAVPHDQLQALAYLTLRLQSSGYDIALSFFGCVGLCVGYLILNSTFLPRILGVLMAIAGVCYFTNAMLGFVAPSLSSMMLLAPCLLGEGALTMWLLLVGVNSVRWRTQAGLGAAA